MRTAAFVASRPSNDVLHLAKSQEADLVLLEATADFADVAGPGEVLASEAVVEATGDGRLKFDRIRDAELKGLSGPIALYRVDRAVDGSRPGAGAS